MASGLLNIILTNDDGYNAPGITSLYDALVAAGNNVHIVAPAVNQSAQGSSLGGVSGLASPIAITQFSPGNYYVDGRPATAALVGLRDLFNGAAPDVIVSGTNRGDNIGESENISGTVNGAVQGLFEGVPAIAVSAGSAGGSYNAAFANAGVFTADLLGRLQAARPDGAPLLPGGEGLTVNVPGNAVSGGVAVTNVTRESSGYFPYQPQGNNTYAEVFTPAGAPSGSPTAEGSSFLSGRITVSPIDGNWGAPAQVRDDLSVRLGTSLVGPATPTARPLNILLINEDGANAAGVAATQAALAAQGHTVTVLSPSTDQSGVGSALFLNPVTVTTTGARSFSANGTPATLTALALDPNGLFNGQPRPDLIIYGVDVGNAVGIENANHSADLGGAITSLFNYGVPSIAVNSQGGSAAALATSTDILTRVISRLQATQGADAAILPAGTGLSINVPTGATAADAVITTIDGGTNADLTVTGNATTASFANGGPVGSADPHSEGVAFNAGHITISPIDGSFAVRDAASYSSLAAALGIQFGQPSPGYTITPSGSGGNDVNLVVLPSLTSAQGSAGVDTVTYQGFGQLTLPANIENAVLTGAGTVVGNDLGNLLRGTDGNNRFVGGLGDDTIDGGAGTDTIVFNETFGASHFDRGAGGAAIFSGPDGLDTVINYEILRFTDETIGLNLAPFGTVDVGAGSRGGALAELYDGLLQRAPDRAGLEFFADQQEAGATLVDIASVFLNSAEYTSRNGPISAEGNAGFVGELYQVVLGRAPDAGGQVYVDQLNAGASRAFVAVEIATSPEEASQIQAQLSAGVYVPNAEASAAARLYLGLLDRAPDMPGLAAATQTLESGGSLASAAANIIGSPEFSGRFGPQSNDAFVSSLYDHALGRDGAAAEIAYWSGQIAAGATRADVAVAIAESPEAVTHLSLPIEQGWLHV